MGSAVKRGSRREMKGREWVFQPLIDESVYLYCEHIMNEIIYLSSGQVRLIRSGGAGAFEVQFDQSTSSDNDDDFYSPLRSRSPPMPRGTFLCY